MKFFSVLLLTSCSLMSSFHGHTVAQPAGNAKTSQSMVNQDKTFQTPVVMTELTSLLSSYRTFQADFQQVTKNQDGKLLQKVNGIIKLQRPGQFYWKAFQPYPQLLVSNGQSIRQYDEDMEQVVVQNYKSQKDAIDLIALLENPELFSQLFNIKAYAEEDKKHLQRFSLASKDNASAIKSIVLVFENRQLMELTFLDAMQQQTTMHFSQRLINKSISAKTFTFVIPKGVDVLYENNRLKNDTSRSIPKP